MNDHHLQQRLSEVQSVNLPAPRKTLSVVLSFWNEQDVLEELIRRQRAVLDGLVAAGRLTDYELIFVNDASTDRSLEILQRAGQGRHDIKVINMSRNFGVSPCVLAGMQHASGDAVVYMDADLQDPPEVIPDLVAAWQDDSADVVHTQRIKRHGEGWIKLLVTRLGYKVIHYVSELDLQIECGDFKLLSRRAVNHMVQFREKKPYVRGLVCWIGFNQSTIKYHRQARTSGDTKFPVFGRKVIRNFLNSALISFSGIPLQLSLLGGLLVSGIAFVMLIYVIIQRIVMDTTPGWSALMVTMLFLGGIQLMTIGIMGLYLSSIYQETKGRPNYIVESSFGFDTHMGTQPAPSPGESSDDSEAKPNNGGVVDSPSEPM